jgi:hypothetical protein
MESLCYRDWRPGLYSRGIDIKVWDLIISTFRSMEALFWITPDVLHIGPGNGHHYEKPIQKLFSFWREMEPPE